MKTRDKAAFIIYFLSCLAILGFGLAYMCCPTIMPYHQEAIKIDWNELNSGVQILLHGMVKMVAAGMFVTGIAGMVLLFIPFKRGESWARWALPLGGLIWNIPGLYVTSTIALKTHASTPWQASLVGIVVMIVAFLLAPPYSKTK